MPAVAGVLRVPGGSESSVFVSAHPCLSVAKSDPLYLRPFFPPIIPRFALRILGSPASLSYGADRITNDDLTWYQNATIVCPTVTDSHTRARTQNKRKVRIGAGSTKM